MEEYQTRLQRKGQIFGSDIFWESFIQICFIFVPVPVWRRRLHISFVPTNSHTLFSFFCVFRLLNMNIYLKLFWCTMWCLLITRAAAILLYTPEKCLGQQLYKSLFLERCTASVFRAKEWLLKLKLCLCAARVAKSSKTLILRLSYTVRAVAMPSNSLAQRQGAKAKVHFEGAIFGIAFVCICSRIWKTTKLMGANTFLSTLHLEYIWWESSWGCFSKNTSSPIVCLCGLWRNRRVRDRVRRGKKKKDWRKQCIEGLF